MKKIIVLVMALLICIGACACGSSFGEVDDEQTQQTNQEMIDEADNTEVEPDKTE